MPKKGLLIVISGFSGVGKGTIVKELLKRYPEEFRLSISATSRKPREGEEEGKHYFFVSRERFREMIDAGALLEYAEYNQNYYGTPKEYVISEAEKGHNVILEIEVQGAFQIRERCPDAVLVFTVPPSIGELRRRLHKRGTETEEVIEKRIARALEELPLAEQYDYIILNDALEDAVRDFGTILRAESLRPAYTDLVSLRKDGNVL